MFPGGRPFFLLQGRPNAMDTANILAATALLFSVINFIEIKKLKDAAKR